MDGKRAYSKRHNFSDISDRKCIVSVLSLWVFAGLRPLVRVYATARIEEVQGVVNPRNYAETCDCALQSAMFESRRRWVVTLMK